MGSLNILLTKENTMHYCSECQTIEGDFKEVEIVNRSIIVERYIICNECGAEDSKVNVPEHDDYDMER